MLTTSHPIVNRQLMNERSAEFSNNVLLGVDDDDNFDSFHWISGLGKDLGETFMKCFKIKADIS